MIPQEDKHYFTPSLSLASSSFQKYNYVWDVNPVTGDKWTQDSLNSLIAGFKYDGGQSGVQISELQLTVSSHLLPEPTPPADESTTQDSSDSGTNDDSGGGNDENSTGDVQDTGNEDGATQDEDQQQEEEPEEPTTESNGSNNTSSEADGEGSSES